MSPSIPDHGQAHSKIPWLQGVLNHWYEGRLLDGTTPPRIKTTYMYVTWHRKIPMHLTFNGYKHCFWCISEEARWSISECSKHNSYCWWYDHLWKITGRTWHTLSQLSFNHEEEQSIIKCFEITIPTQRSILFQTQIEFQRGYHQTLRRSMQSNRWYFCQTRNPCKAFEEWLTS